MDGSRNVGEKGGRERIKSVQTFKDLIVWQKAHDLFLPIATRVDSFPNKRAARVVCDQILRSCGSISANISEGFGRKTRADYEHFLIIARWSTTETQNWLVKCRDLKFIDDASYDDLDNTCVEVIKMINSLIGSLRRKSASSLTP